MDIIDLFNPGLILIVFIIQLVFGLFMLFLHHTVMSTRGFIDMGTYHLFIVMMVVCVFLDYIYDAPLLMAVFALTAIPANLLLLRGIMVMLNKDCTIISYTRIKQYSLIFFVFYVSVNIFNITLNDVLVNFSFMAFCFMISGVILIKSFLTYRNTLHLALGILLLFDGIQHTGYSISSLAFDLEPEVLEVSEISALVIYKAIVVSFFLPNLFILINLKDRFNNEYNANFDWLGRVSVHEISTKKDCLMASNTTLFLVALKFNSGSYKNKQLYLTECIQHIKGSMREGDVLTQLQDKNILGIVYDLNQARVKKRLEDVLLEFHASVDLSPNRFMGLAASNSEKKLSSLIHHASIALEKSQQISTDKIRSLSSCYIVIA